MQVKCGCGKLLNVPEAMAGKSGKCPACGKVIKIPSPRDSASSDAAPDEERIVVTCSCGKKLRTLAKFAGKKVKCPACGEPVAVVAPKASPEVLFELDLAPPKKEPKKAPAEVPKEAGAAYGVVQAKCPNCGASLEEGAQFCIACGTNIATGAKRESVDLDAMRNQKNAAARKKMMRMVGIIIAAVVALAAAGFVAWWFWLRDADPGAGNKGDEGYLEMTAYAPGRARDKITLISMKHTIDSFKALHDRWPKSLDELKEEFPNLPHAPPGMEFEYDAATGKIDSYRIKGRPK